MSWHTLHPGQYSFSGGLGPEVRPAQDQPDVVDEIVFRAMAKWPNVPAVYGWLALDRRGRWRLRGETLGHAATVAFINRNYAGDERGRWYFQNGPQRVFVRLGYTPHVLSLDGATRLRTHTGARVRSLLGAALDEEGSLLLLCEHGPGVLDDRDLLAVSEGFVDGRGRAIPDDVLEEAIVSPNQLERTAIFFRWSGMSAPLETITRAQAPARFGFVADPGPED